MRVVWDNRMNPTVCRDTESRRPALQRIFIDPDGWLVAIDGFLMSVLPCTITGDDNELANFKDRGGVSLDPEMFIRAGAVAPRRGDATLIIDNHQAIVILKEGLELFGEIDESSDFPTWRRMVPSFEQIQEGFDAASTAVDYTKLGQCTKALGGKALVCKPVVDEPGSPANRYVVYSMDAPIWDNDRGGFCIVMGMYTTRDRTMARLQKIATLYEEPDYGTQVSDSTDWTCACPVVPDNPTHIHPVTKLVCWECGYHKPLEMAPVDGDDA